LEDWSQTTSTEFLKLIAVELANANRLGKFPSQNSNSQKIRACVLRFKIFKNKAQINDPYSIVNSLSVIAFLTFAW
jgi:hypothetical protein